MDALIEYLNLWGERAVNFAWPMMWQSALLMAVLFAFDFAFRRRIRASVRYALWLVVLVKLMLPPSLASPTSLAWWVRPPTAVVVPTKQEPTTTFLVTYRDLMPATVPTFSQPVTTSSRKPSLSTAGWAVLNWIAVSVGLLAWLLVRWWQVARDARRSTCASERLNDLLSEAQKAAGVNWRVKLRLTTLAMSPAVCGLIRPVILLPQSLVARLTPEQLRAVLLHELIHLRRGDVWVNCLQALLQVFYWWHPLLWLANGRIRRVREEAVDDAVMLALADDAEAYPPTLLEVAKLAFNRPLATLGLVGILEPRSALRQRIERLMDFRPPRKVGLTIVSTLCVVAFAAVAVPMEQAPSSNETNSANGKRHAPDTGAVIQDLPDLSDTRTNVPVPGDTLLVSRLFQSDATVNVLADLRQKPTVPPATVGPLPSSPLLETRFFKMKLKDITALHDLIERLSVDLSPPKGCLWSEETGVLVVRATTDELNIIEKELAVFSPKVPEAEQLYTRTFKFDTNRFYTNLVTLGFLDALPPGLQPGPLADASGTNFMQQVSIAFQSYLTLLGVDLNPLLGKAVFFKDRAGLLLVRATKQDLDAIEQALAELSATKPQIQIEARFVEMTQDWFLGNPLMRDRVFTNSAGTGPMQVYGILTDPQYRVVLRAFEQQSGVALLSAPRVTTLTGRQAQIQFAHEQTVVTGLNPQALIPPGITDRPNDTSQLYQTNAMQFGPVLDVTPQVSADGYTISVVVVAAVLEFLGYAENSNSVSAYINGQRKQVAWPLPEFRSREMTASANLWDGQTLVLGNPLEYVTSTKPNGETETQEVTGSNKKTLVVFVTARLVDEAGNPIHGDDEMPFAKDSIPPQTPSHK